MMSKVQIKGLRELKKAFERVGKEALKEFETVSLEIGQVVLTGQKTFHGQPFSQVQMDIYQAGNLFAYGKALGE